MELIKFLEEQKDENKASHLMRFFKTAKGQYGYGDKFLGICVPANRIIAKKYYKNIALDYLQEMLNNPYHEIRLCALLMMVLLYEKTDKKKEILNLYVKNTERINNWDLVDLSAPKIIGANYIETKNPKIINELAQKDHLWSQRIAVVSQQSVIKSGDFSIILELAQKFLEHKHDLMQKALGWMLREVGKKDEKTLLDFLDKHHKIMPRTMLRYSIERLTPQQKKYYMS